MQRVLLFILLVAGCRNVPEQIDEALRIEMIAVPGGTFVMGDVFERENEDALPLHHVKVEPFSIGKHEVTFTQYDAFAAATGRPLPDDDGFGRGRRAVVNVSWNDAGAFCESRGFRLPTEAEWEYAARGGGQGLRYAGTNDAGELRSFAFLGDNSPGFSAPVGLKQPNPLGLHDMTGNVSEWIGAFYEAFPAEGQEPVFKDLSKPGIRIIRGGSFTTSGNPPSHIEIAQTFWRSGALDDTESFSIGFRCADS